MSEQSSHSNSQAQLRDFGGSNRALAKGSQENLALKNLKGSKESLSATKGSRENLARLALMKGSHENLRNVKSQSRENLKNARTPSREQLQPLTGVREIRDEETPVRLTGGAKQVIQNKKLTGKEKSLSQEKLSASKNKSGSQSSLAGPSTSQNKA
ncbi:unnamed protein product, partial [Lymnaea stagnalis]